MMAQLLRASYVVAGAIAHQTHIPIDGYPRVFTVGWRELTKYAIGSLCVLQLCRPLSRRYGLSKEQANIAHHAHLDTLVLFGLGTAMGWAIDGIKHYRSKR